MRIARRGAGRCADHASRALAGRRTSSSPVRGGRASASLRDRRCAGRSARRRGVCARRRDRVESVPLVLDAPGRPLARASRCRRDTFAPGAPVNVSLRDVAPGAGTTIVRISRGAPSGSALFDSAPALLAIGLAATQISAPEGRHLASVGRFDRRPRAGARLRAAHAARRRISRSSKPTRKPSRGTSRAPTAASIARADAERARALYALGSQDHRRRARERRLVADNGAVSAA